MVRRAAAVVGLLLLLAAVPGRAADAIRIGYLGPVTGIFAAAGKDMLDGLKMALEQVNYEAAGRKIELIEEDDEGNPATAQAKYRKLVAQDRIHVLDGVLLANIGYALVPNIERDRLPTLFLTTPDDLTKRRLTKYALRTNFAASQPMHALGDYAAKTLKYKRVAAVAMDNPFGHEQIGGFQRVFEDGGGRVSVTSRLDGRVVAIVRRRLEKLVGIVHPELRDHRIGVNDGVLEPAVHLLDLHDVHVLRGISVFVELDRTARIRRHVRRAAQRGEEAVAVLDVAADRRCPRTRAGIRRCPRGRSCCPWRWRPRVCT